MKKLIILPFLLFGLFGWAQSQFVIQNAAKTEVYSNINDAISNAISGDTIYIPGGGFAISPTTIDKTLHWVGHGHYPAATSATMQSRITSSLTFTGNCDNSSFEGIFFTSNLLFGSVGDEAINIKMKRCRVAGSLNLRASATGNPDLNFHLTESVVSYIYASNGSNCLVDKNLIFNTIHDFVISLFNHNTFILHYGSSYNRCINNFKSCDFKNNVFAHMYGTPGTTSCTFQHNVFSGGLPYNSLNPSDTNTGSDNIADVGEGNVFTDISASANIYTFDYYNNYHLQSNWLSDDGSSNVGIYGTTTPYKTIPYYPHINTATIASEAINDQLGIDINVKAQER